jgi:HEAT repeat protein
MARGRLEQQLAAIDSLDTAGLQKALRDRNNFYVSKIAARIEALGLKQLLPDLVAAYLRFFDLEDKQCWAKNALVKAMGELGHDDPAEYLRGLYHFQMEPVWGGQTDTAGTLRGYCALALVGCRSLPSIDLLRHLTRVLLDSDKGVRIVAARAVARIGRDEGALLLRLRALQGDAEPEVVGAVFSGVIAIEQTEGVRFVAGFLDSDSEIAAEAALSLGESHSAEAFEILTRRLESPDGRSIRRSLIAAIALTRLSEATAYLLELIRRGSPGASEAKQALLDYGALSEDERAQLQKSI